MSASPISFSISKSFGKLVLIPCCEGLRFSYSPTSNHHTPSSCASQSGNAEQPKDKGDAASVKGSEACLDLLLPLETIGGLWATTRAFIYGVESLDENIVLRSGSSCESEASTEPKKEYRSAPFASDTSPAENGEVGDSDILVKLYRDKPRGPQGRLSGDENCWLRIVTGRSEDERRRIKLGPRDLLCIELACQSVMTLSSLSKA